MKTCARLVAAPLRIATASAPLTVVAPGTRGSAGCPTRMAPAVEQPTLASPQERLLRRVGIVTFAIALIAGAIRLATIELEGALAELVLRWGYAGYLVAAMIAGINICLPTTHLVFTAPLLNAGLDPGLLVVCGALGATVADGVGYFIGSSGRAVFSLARIANWLAGVVSRHPRTAPAILFLWAAFVPLPNEILVIPAGALGYGVARTSLIMLSGNIVLNTLAVVLGLAAL